MNKLEVEASLELSLQQLKALRDEAGRSEGGRQLSIAVTELEAVLLRVRFGDRLPK